MILWESYGGYLLGSLFILLSYVFDFRATTRISRHERTSRKYLIAADSVSVFNHF